MSIAMVAARLILGRQPNSLRTRESARTMAEARGEDAPVPGDLASTCEVREELVHDFRVTTLSPRTGSSGVEILYLHGGAFINALIEPHWAIIGELITRTGATVTVPSYGLAPQHTAADAAALVDSVFTTLTGRASASQIYVAGDSAGGTLAVNLATRCRDRGLPMPRALFLFAPWLDLSMSNPDMMPLAPRDVILDIPGLTWCSEQWVRGSSLQDPSVNPIVDHLRNLPATYIYQGDRDIFVADARKYSRKATESGSFVDLKIYRGGFHVFVGAPSIPESRRVFRHVAAVIVGQR